MAPRSRRASLVSFTSIALVMLIGTDCMRSMPARADAPIPADDQGCYTEGGSHDPIDGRYLAGRCELCPFAPAHRNFFIFDLTAANPGALPIDSVLLRVDANGYESQDASETYVLHEVTTDPVVLATGGSGLTAIYDDLGDGTVFGSRVFTPTDENQTVDVTLDAAGVAAVEAAIGGTLAIGGAVTTLDNDDLFEQLFNAPGVSPGTVELIIVACGDGSLAGSEACDDGNVSSGDGCSGTCTCEATPDGDGDGASNPCDNCPLDSNPGQEDADGDGVGDACDNCPLDANADQADGDNDGDGDVCDNCPADADATQADSDGDNIGDVCDPCTNPGDAHSFSPTSMRFKNLGFEVDPNDTFGFSGEWVLPDGFADVTPLTEPIRLSVVMNGLIETTQVIDITLPTTSYGGSGTAGWKLNGAGTRYGFTDKTGTPDQGIVSVRLDDRSKKGPGRVRIKARGKNAPYDAATTFSSMSVTVVVGDPAAGECGEVVFTPGDCDLDMTSRFSCKEQ